MKNLTSSSILYTRMKFSSRFLNSAFQKLPFKTYFFQIERRNHSVKRKAPKLILKPVHKSKEKELLHPSLVNSLQKCKSVEEQIKVFHSIIKLPDESIDCRYSICQELETVLQEDFPSCFVRLIGSSVNGLGFKGCDVDLSIQFPNININEESKTENICQEEEIEFPASKVHSLKFQLKLLKTIRKIMQSRKYDEPLEVIPGRCPILNFTAKNFSCDLAIDNSLALQSTNLMQLCGKLDERVTPLMQIITYWAKHLKLVGGPWRFKTYAIFLMMIYFLQTRNPPVLPSVEIMLAKTDLLHNFGNWSYDVNAYLNEFEKSKNSETLEELLKNFFFFYRAFDFKQIICPINSSSMDEKSFMEIIDYNKKFEINTISIQDPLEKTWNVTSGTNYRHCKKFITAIISVLKKYQDQNLWIPGPHSWGLATLIDQNKKKTFNQCTEFISE